MRRERSLHGLARLTALAAATVAMLALAVPAVALGAEARVEADGADLVLVYDGGFASQDGSIRLVSSTPNRYEVNDPNGINPGAGCVNLNVDTVACADIGIDRIVADLGAAADSLAVATSVTIPVAAMGGIGSDSVTGGNGNDLIEGGAGDDVLAGGAGDDVVHGLAVGNASGGGDDEIAGDGGSDTLHANTEADLVDGGSSGSAGDTVVLTTHPSTGAGSTANLGIGGGGGQGVPGQNAIFRGIENIDGSPGDDTLIGSTTGNRISGGDGADTIDGRTGTDVIEGGNGPDAITSRDQVFDRINCGGAVDPTVIADQLDQIASDCEAVDLGDTEPPNTVIVSGPAEGEISNDNDPVFTYAGSPVSDTVRFECSLDGAAFAPCPGNSSGGSKAFTNLADLPHSFAVRAVDAFDNVDESPATLSWFIDTVPPDTTIDSGPAPGETTADNDPVFTYSGAPAAETHRFECSLDGSAFTPCPETGTAFVDLPDGEHRFEVRAVDGAGNTDGSPAARTWTIVAPTEPPQTSPVPPPALPSQPATVDNSAACAELRKKLKKAKRSLKKAKRVDKPTKKKRRKVRTLRRKLRGLGC